MTVLGGENYDSTINGKTQYPVVADPSATEVNQAYLTYAAGEQLVRIGRQAVNLDNLRFVGTVAWRQNNQTLDTLVLNTTAVDKLSLLYAFVWNVNRVFSDAHPLGDLATNSHVINASYTGFSDVTVIAHGLVLDLDDAAGLSSWTTGVRVEGDLEVGEGARLAYEAEYAIQEDHADSPHNYHANHLAGALACSVGGFTVQAGYESLGSDNGVSFSTPLATLYKFNGWADTFLTTPPDGLEDIYAGITYRPGGGRVFKDTLLKVVYHDFSAYRGDQGYGTEWDWLISKQVNTVFTIAFQGAHYHADRADLNSRVSRDKDTSKLWFIIAARLQGSIPKFSTTE